MICVSKQHFCMFCPALWHVGGGVSFTVPVTIGENLIVTSVLIHVA